MAVRLNINSRPNNKRTRIIFKSHLKRLIVVEKKTLMITLVNTKN